MNYNVEEVKTGINKSLPYVFGFGLVGVVGYLFFRGSNSSSSYGTTYKSGVALSDTNTQEILSQMNELKNTTNANMTTLNKNLETVQKDTLNAIAELEKDETKDNEEMLKIGDIIKNNNITYSNMLGKTNTDIQTLNNKLTGLESVVNENITKNNVVIPINKTTPVNTPQSFTPAPSPDIKEYNLARLEEAKARMNNATISGDVVARDRELNIIKELSQKLVSPSVSIPAGDSKAMLIARVEEAKQRLNNATSTGDKVAQEKELTTIRELTRQITGG